MFIKEMIYRLKGKIDLYMHVYGIHKLACCRSIRKHNVYMYTF